MYHDMMNIKKVKVSHSQVGIGAVGDRRALYLGAPFERQSPFCYLIPLRFETGTNLLLGQQREFTSCLMAKPGCELRTFR